MKEYASDMIRNVAVLSHDGAGKTAVVESLLLACGAVDAVGTGQDNKHIMIGVITHQTQGHILYVPAICAGVGAIFGAQLGAKMSKKIKGRAILMLLAFALFLLAVRLILTSFNI